MQSVLHKKRGIRMSKGFTYENRISYRCTQQSEGILLLTIQAATLPDGSILRPFSFQQQCMTWSAVSGETVKGWDIRVTSNLEFPALLCY